MLEIRHLNKTYKSENGKNVKALKDVNLSFGDSGLVFILGKSGSGKSTFLNVVGGLDSFDSGEIVIDGKSSATFSRSDFDSYRNTYLGFIFQEFNVLDNFTVAKNIMLALQLQQKPATDKEVEDILKLVDLEGYGKRHPYELSGGQKQRVAIARALIKSPSIILADEPTGALDDNTGTQVFETLKNLSKDKLVIVVSHNREFAEVYADRIIELSDGCVISDKTRKIDVALFKEEDDNNALFIKKGTKLTQKLIDKINQLLANVKDDVYLSIKDKNEIEYNKVALEGKTQTYSFTPTDEKQIVGKKEGLQLIESKLPFMDVVKMALSSFFSKKFRLVITLLLSVLSLVCFGFSVMLSGYDKEISYAKTYYEGNAYYMTLNKTEEINSTDYAHLPFLKEDLVELENRFPDGIIKMYDLISADFGNLTGKKEVVDTGFYDRVEHPVIAPSMFDGIIEAKMGALEIVYGNYPANVDEACISDLFADYFIEYGMRVGVGNGQVVRIQIDEYEQLLDKVITVGGNPYRIVGVFRTNYNEYKQAFLGKTAEDIANSTELSTLSTNYKTDEAMLMTKLLVADGYVSRFSKEKYTFDAELILKGDKELNEIPYGASIERDTLYGLKQGEIYLSANYYRTIFYGAESTKTYRELLDDINANPNVSLYLKANKDVRSDTQIFSETFTIKGLYDDLYAVIDPVITMNYNDFVKIIEAKYTPKTVLVDANLSTTSLHDLLSTLHKEGYITYARNDEALQVVDELMQSFTVVLYILAVVMAIFVVLILYNFISTSIAHKTKEIGILRALGARSIDVVGIFVVEGVLLGIVINVLSIPITVITSKLLVNYLYAVLPVSIISFTNNIILLMVALAFAIILISSFVPVLRIARKKPIDAIRKE